MKFRVIGSALVIAVLAAILYIAQDFESAEPHATNPHNPQPSFSSDEKLMKSLKIE